MCNLFITGTYRSGTTLLQKLINGHPSANIFSQPCAPLFFEAKNKFYLKNKLRNLYPIDPAFSFSGFSWEELYRFLESESLDRADLKQIFELIRKYNGILTPEVRTLE